LPLLSLGSPVGAATFQVSNTSGAGTGSFHQALLDASTAPNPPHTIMFSTSFPQAGVVVLQSVLPQWSNGQLTIDGNNKAPIIDGSSNFSILVVGSGGTSLNVSGVHFRNGRRSSSGGCIALVERDQLASLSVSQSSFQNCRAFAIGSPSGGAIYWEAGAASSISIQNSLFEQNRTVAVSSPPTIPGGNGGAIQLQGSNITLQANVIRENLIDVGAATSGGSGGGVGVFLLNDGSAQILGNEFRANSATPLTADGLGLGGALNISCNGACQWSIERNYFRGNSARRGGAIWGPGSFGGSAAAKTVALVNNSFVNNEVIDAGGALYLVSLAPRLQHNSFFGNGAASAAHMLITSATGVELANNLLAAANSGTACGGNVVSPTVLLGNLSKSACAMGATSFSLYAGMPDPIIDENGIGVLDFSGDASIVDGVVGPASAHCPALDARGNTRPVDGNDDGSANCDVGAYEHPSPILLRSGFES
jgi:hypothetical protein